MKITYTGRQVELVPAQLKKLEAQFSKIGKLLDGKRECEAHVILSLERHLHQALQHFSPEIIFYVAGADPYCEDQLGGLSLTMEGLRQRDDLVFDYARRHGVAVAITLAGGYARQVTDTVQIHVNTIVAARYGRRQSTHAQSVLRVCRQTS